MATRRRLPAGALKGRSVALSVSDSDDLARLGLMPVHLKLALAEIARVVLVAGGRLIYGGDLRAGGFTELLLYELSRYGRARDALTVCLAWSVHRRTPLSVLDEMDRSLGLRGSLVALGPGGEPLEDWRAGRGEAGEDVAEAAARAEALAAMRRWTTAQADARVLIGGRRRDPATLSGVVGEALMGLEAGLPLYLAGGFGGSTLDLCGAVAAPAGALGLHTSGAPAGVTAQALQALAARVGGRGFAALRNGLDEAQNLRLAATHRPSEIAALVAGGLGSLAG